MAVVSTYQQDDEPSDLTPGTGWLRGDGKEYVRKLDLSWNYVGEWQLSHKNNLPIEGGTMMGPILGSHGLAPLDNPAFTGAATQNGVDLADKDYLTNQLAALQLTLTSLITNQVGGTMGNITIGGNLAVGYGTVSDGGTIPLPIYADNVRASLSEVWGVLASMKSLTGHDGSEANDWTFEVNVDASLNVTCTNVESHWGTFTGVASYIVMCKR